MNAELKQRDAFQEQGMVSHPGSLTDAQFERWTGLLKRRTGIDIGRTRRVFLETHLRMRMRAAGFEDYDSYFAFVADSRRGVIEWVKLVDQLTVHETRFNRHPPSMKLIEEHLRQRCDGAGEGEQRCNLDLWSVGCATGEEAYSLAIVLDRLCTEQGGRCYYSVTGTDISRGSLDYARRAEYPSSGLQGLKPHERETYFEEFDEGIYRVDKRLRERTCFIAMNILELDSAPLAKMDVILCQNVLIYFGRERRLQILDRLTEFLKPGGLIVLGLGEVTNWRHQSMERVSYKDTLAYRKKPAA